MTSESITREVAEERLLTEGYHPGDVKGYLRIAYPPKFIPKLGEVIVVWGKDKPEVYREFVQMQGDEYFCLDDGQDRNGFEWSNARPQTPKEKGD